MNSKEKVLELIDEHRESSIEFLKTLVKHRSLIEEPCKDVQTIIAKRFQEIGLEVDMYEPDIEALKKYKWFKIPLSYYPDGFKDMPNVIGKATGSGDGKSIILNGHIDVVTDEPRELWKHDPWNCEIENGKMYGRGTSDCKGGIAAMTMAISCVLEAGIKLKGDVILQSVVEHEIGGAGTMSTILKGYTADAAIFTEPFYSIGFAGVGVFWFRATVEGRSAHAAELLYGVNAINKAIKIHEILNEWGENRMKNVKHPLWDSPIHAAYNPGTFISGGYASSVPHEAILEYRVALVPGENIEEVFDEMKKIVEQVANQDEWMKEHPPKVDISGWFAPPCYLEKDHPLVKTLAKSFREVNKREPEYRAATEADDKNLLSNFANIPSITFGCHGEGLHQNDEYIVIDDFINVIKVLALFIMDWCGLT